MRGMHKSFIVLALATSIFLMSMANAYAAEIPTYTTKVGQQKKIAFTFTNNQVVKQPYALIIQVKNEEDFTDQLSWLVGIFEAEQEFRTLQSWIPEKPGTYTVEVFVWESANNPVPLGPVLTMKVIVEP